MLALPITSENDRMTTKESKSKFLQDAPPLLLTLTSSKYHIKWKRLADLPAAIHSACIAVQGRKIYVSCSTSPVKDARHQVFVYDADNDRWGQLPTPDHYLAIPHIIGGKLTLIGGRLIVTNKVTNKVSTFDHIKQSWVSYYPNLLSVRSLPGVGTHMEYVIVAGGARGDDTLVVLDDIEILDWLENSQWKRVVIHLPAPMCGFQLTVANDHLFVVGYTNASWEYDKHVYKLPVTLITNPAHQQQCTFTRWVELTQTTHWGSSLVTGLSSLIVVGGLEAHTATADIMMYDNSTEKWKKIDSLSFARSKPVATAINSNAIIVIGGYTSFSDAKSTSLTVVELGQVEEDRDH